MDKMLRVHQKKATKQPNKIKKKPVKVVYISNPMKVKTSASEFRALVQELTGQGADMPDPSKFMDIQSVGGGSQEEEEERPNYEMKGMEVTTRTPTVQIYPGISEMSIRSESDLSFETFDGDDAMFIPQMLENFPSSGGLLSSASWYNESNHIAGELKSLDAM